MFPIKLDIMHVVNCAEELKDCLKVEVYGLYDTGQCLQLPFFSCGALLVLIAHYMFYRASKLLLDL